MNISAVDALQRRLTPLNELPNGYIKIGRLLHIGTTLLTAYQEGLRPSPWMNWSRYSVSGHL